MEISSTQESISESGAQMSWMTEDLHWVISTEMEAETRQHKESVFRVMETLTFKALVWLFP